MRAGPSDVAGLRAILQRDPVWAVYALGDLDPRRRGYCDWWTDGSAVVLLYREFGTPVLFALGEPGAVIALVSEANPRELTYLHVRPEVLDALRPAWTIHKAKRMLRMSIGDEALPGSGAAVRLAAADLRALERLYSDGELTEEAPDFFFASMVTEGVFYGFREGPDLVAAAGTHLVSTAESVAAIGNVYTRRDRRGRGLAALLTAAVVRQLGRMGVRTIALSVAERNEAAIHVYERLGFRRHCVFVEGEATPTGP